MEPINVRTARLNNIIIGKGKFGVNINQQQRRRAAVAGAHTLVNVGGRKSNSATEAPVTTELLNRECLLDAFFVLFDECSKDVLKKSDRNIAEFVKKFLPLVKETRALRVNISDFTVKSLIGKGYYGEVHLVVERQTNDIYAMKKTKKTALNSSMAKVERDIMAMHGSEWIVGLQYAFQDAEHLYLVMEYMPGGDLLGLMMRMAPFDEEVTRFYLAELAVAIHTVHMLGFVHRDIKPENILFDFFGHIKLADFGNAALLDRDGQVSSMLPVGTPDYIAPELLETLSTYKATKSIHNVKCDFWSMGIIGYELMCEVTPFHEENVHETYSKILCHCEDSPYDDFITFPSDMKLSENFKTLIQSLVSNPSRRADYAQIRQHPFFEKIQWETLRSQVPPFIPSIKNAADTAYFEVAQPLESRRAMMAKPLSNPVKANGFSGKDLPYIGYSYVHEEGSSIVDNVNDIQLTKLNDKMKEMQTQLRQRTDEATKLKQELLRAEELEKSSNSQKLLLQDAKEDIKRMKSVLKEKNKEIAVCKAKIKTLQNAMKVEAEMWQKKEDTITELLRLNRQKYEEAKIASEQRYEQIIAEKVHEVTTVAQKIEARETELKLKTEECRNLEEKLESYKEIQQKVKQKAERDKDEYEKRKRQLTETYEKKIADLTAQLANEAGTKTRLSVELRDARTELDDSKKMSNMVSKSKETVVKANNEILRRLNDELQENNELRAHNIEIEQKLARSEQAVQQLTQEVQRLERELQVAECSKKLGDTSFGSPFQTAPGSLSDLHYHDDQLRTELDAAKEQEQVQRERADSLEEVVKKLEKMIEQFTESSGSGSPTKSLTPPESQPEPEADAEVRSQAKFQSKSQPQPKPRQRNGKNDSGSEGSGTLENRLSHLREQIVKERKEARQATVALYRVEKQLEEALAENKITKRRMELTTDRIQSIKAERDETKTLCVQFEQQVVQRDEQIRSLQKQIQTLKAEMAAEHRKWESSEQKRMESKSEIKLHINRINELEKMLRDIKQEMEKTNQLSEIVENHNQMLSTEVNEERTKKVTTEKKCAKLEAMLVDVQDKYDHLKLACTVLDNQMTEMEGMFNAEKAFTQEQKAKIQELLRIIGDKDENISKLKREVCDTKAAVSTQEARVALLQSEIKDHKSAMAALQSKYIAQQNELLDSSTKLIEVQEANEMLGNETEELQARIVNADREIDILKQENTRILTDLYHAKEEAEKLMERVNDSNEKIQSLNEQLEKVKSELHEKEHHFKQREIKSDATLAQHKKLIDYLQLTIQDLSTTKKRTLTNMLFGSSKKENVPPGTIEGTIVYRTLEEELRREKQLTKSLKDKVKKLETAKQTLSENFDYEQNNKNASPTKGNNAKQSKEQTGTEKIATTTTGTLHIKNPVTQSYHRFQLALQETNINASNCGACSKPILANTGYWKCRECGQSTHRNCRDKVDVACGSSTSLPAADNGQDTDSVDKYSYSAKLDDSDEETDEGAGGGNTNESGTLVFTVSNADPNRLFVVNCAHEMKEEKIVLFGCNTGLYAFHMNNGNLVHIGGIDSVNNIDISKRLSKVLMIGSNGKSLYQCDYRMLQTRSHANAALKPALKATLLDIPFANRDIDCWQIIKISNLPEHDLDPVAIAATTTRLVVLKYDLNIQQFKPVRSMDTATPISAVLFTSHTVIVSSDKFYEIDLSNYIAEEFLDVADPTLATFIKCQPIVAIATSKHEFLLCFAECGVFVDEYGCRARPYDLHWDYTPTGFLYSEPFLYISHFQSVQIIRLHRSYAKDCESMVQKSCDDAPEKSPAYKRIILPYYMPGLLTRSGRYNVYTTAVQKETGLQEIYHIDALRLFKHQYNESMESISSIGTSITLAPSEQE